jgi:hypothetical protein
MVPAHELAVHAWLSTCAVVSVTRIVCVDGSGTEEEPDPQGNKLALNMPLYTAPARARVTLNVCPLIPPESTTAHAPAAHFGLACHDSTQLLGAVRSALPRTILRLTFHGPCQRAAEMGGVRVVTTMMADAADRLPPRTATTRYRYAMAGASPVPRYDVTVPGTEPITLRSCRIMYLSGAGPVAGPDQRNVTELVVEGPATSPAGRNNGGLCHGAQMTSPAITPATATTAIAIMATARLPRPRRTTAGTTGAVTGENSAGCVAKGAEAQAKGAEAEAKGAEAETQTRVGRSR